MAKPTLNHPELPIGTKITGIDGNTYTRIARLNRSDWINTRGQQYAALPCNYTLTHKPDKADLHAGFNATPTLSPTDHGFGIVADHELIPGDIIFTPGFKKQLHTIEQVGVVHRWWKPRIITITNRGIWLYPPKVVYIARNLGPNPSEYSRWGN